MGPILFDRGIPDILGYAAVFGFDFPHCENAAQVYRYNPQAFVAPAWEQIYCTDDERVLPFSEACEFGNRLRAIYKRLEYTLIDLRMSPSRNVRTSSSVTSEFPNSQSAGTQVDVKSALLRFGRLERDYVNLSSA